MHPNPILYQKLQQAKNLPITEQVNTLRGLETVQFEIQVANTSVNSFPFVRQDLEYLSEGLEGRSGNPVAVLFDTLMHPNADFGYELPPVVQWKRDKQQQIPHLVLGSATPGGAWHVRNLFSSLSSLLSASPYLTYTQIHWSPLEWPLLPRFNQDFFSLRRWKDPC